jgi:hypothetical protein
MEMICAAGKKCHHEIKIRKKIKKFQRTTPNKMFKVKA